MARGRLARIRHTAPVWLRLIALIALVGAAGLQAQSGVPEGYELVYSQDFADASALDDFTFSDQRAWKYGKEERGYLDLVGGSKYKPKHRSPLNIAMIDDLLLADFVLEAEAWQTGREYGHRDLSLFFGFEGPNRYYYAHLATEPDDRAHNIFLVDNADRAPLGAIPDEGVDWGKGWKRVRVERRDGALRVYFDGEKDRRPSRPTATPSAGAASVSAPSTTPAASARCGSGRRRRSARRSRRSSSEPLAPGGPMSAIRRVVW